MVMDPDVLFQMAELRMQGYSYASIARTFKTTRQNVRQRLKNLAKSQGLKYPSITKSLYRRVAERIKPAWTTTKIG